MKPGWKTTEFWIAGITQVLGFLTVLGVITSKDRENLQDALVNMVGAVAALIVNGAVVNQYIRSRLTLKTSSNPQGSGPTENHASPTVTIVLLACLGALAIPGEAKAQSVLPWRNQMEQRLRDQNQLIQSLIANQRQTPPIIVHPQPQVPLPIQGDPKQQLPISGEPKQQLPPGGEPKQQLPILGPPKQELPSAPPIGQSPMAYSIRAHALSRPIP